jgi:hypothetical protein
MKRRRKKEMIKEFEIVIKKKENSIFEEV